MKKLITGIALMLISTVSYAIEFECTGYFNGSAVGESIKVNAAKEIVADTKAKSRFKKAGFKIDYVRCK
ncbi:MAG: hypothetical protein ACKE51_01420 [Methylococcaceae bacterium]